MMKLLLDYIHTIYTNRWNQLYTSVQSLVEILCNLDIKSIKSGRISSYYIMSSSHTYIYTSS